MDHHLLLLLLIIMAGTAACKVYYVVPSQEKQCEDKPCVTLTQLATDYSHYVDTTNITLVLEPGNHTLSANLIISDISQFAIVSHYSILPTVTCSKNARTVFINITQVYIHGTRFHGCGRNLYVSINQLILKNVTFMDHSEHHSGTALELNQTAAVILHCSFINLVGTFNNFMMFGIPVNLSIGGALKLVQSNLTIIRSTFQGNSATLGGALYATRKCNITILSTVFTRNRAVCNDEHCMNGSLLNVPQGGALFIHNSNLSIEHTFFDSNYANGLGGAMHAIKSDIRTVATTFVHNSARMNTNSGGVISAIRSTVIFTESTFGFNRADYGGVIDTLSSIITLKNNTFISNKAQFDGGVLKSYKDYVYVNGCQFINSSAELGGSIEAESSYITAMFNFITNCTAHLGGAVKVVNCNVKFNQNTFSHNYANFIGVLDILASNVTMYEDIFVFNMGEVSVIGAYFSTVTICNIFVGYNKARHGPALDMIQVTFSSYGIFNIIKNIAKEGVIECDLCQAHFSSRTLFNNNIGSIIIFNSKVTFSGLTYISNCSSTTTSVQSVLLIQFSTVVINGISIIANNQALQGGAINIIESQIFLYGDIRIINNTAILDAGGVYLYKSQFSCRDNSTLIIHGNKAGFHGGGLKAESSSIFVTTDFLPALPHNRTSFLVQASRIKVVKNQAKYGGGLYLWNSNLYLFTNVLGHFKGNIINFKQNFATQYGGAIYVNDDSSMCSRIKTERPNWSACFLQIISFKVGPTYLNFSQNHAKSAGSTIFGGLLDRCVVQNGSHPSNLTGTSFLSLVSNIDSLDTITSYPARVCFCRERKPDCSYEHPPIYVMKGHPFTLPVVAVDQANHTAKYWSITSFLNSRRGGLGIDQRTQKTKESCTDLEFNVFSPYTSIELILLARGPCRDTLPSLRRVKIMFIPCSCPIGFQPTNADKSKCECGCDPKLPYIKKCDPHQKSLIREGNFWIMYLNNSDTNSSGYVGYRHCPLDYCLPATSKVNIFLSIPNGSDIQCAFNRLGLLCGECKPQYSISLGSSHCIQCSSNQLKWLLPLIIVVALIGGIILVAILLILNLTVARGTLNGIIFYANIAFTNESSFFPFTKPNFISVIISWLNLEIGLDICFYNGMDIYWKTWIQLAFSAYLFFLVAMIIIVSERSTILSSIIRRKNPVATLATLILLSYAKLLHIIISALSFAIIKHPNGSKKIVWLPDATIEYWSGKHIALFLIAIVLLFVWLIFTTLLLFWQWLLPRQDWKLLHWIKNQKLCMFIETYHAPYNFKHRYWTGLLLLLRIVLSVIASVNVSGDPAINLLANCVLIVTLMVFKSYVQGTKPVYKIYLIDILETACLINLLTLSLFKLYTLTENTNQVVIAYISGIIIIIKFASVIFYHICTEILMKTKIWNAIKKCSEKKRENEGEDELMNILASTSDDENEVSEPTFTIIERPTPQKPLSDIAEERSEGGKKL